MDRRILFFENGIRCLHHNHGASCAVDALIELFYYGVFCLNPGVSGGQLITKLNELCEKRNMYQVSSCLLREDVWDWLVHTLPGAYAPKGKHTAEILCGLQMLCQDGNAFFQTTLRADTTCTRCDTLQKSMWPIHVLTLAYNYSTSNNGMLDKCVEENIMIQVKHLRKPCSGCTKKTSIRDAGIQLAEFFMIELGLVNSKNKQFPPIKICEEINLFGVRYQLTGCVMTEPGHFLNVIKIENQYVVIDSLPKQFADGTTVPPDAFMTFSAAVYQNHSISSKIHLTSSSHNGIHVLLYHKMEDSKLQISTNGICLGIKDDPVAEVKEDKCTKTFTLPDVRRDDTNSTTLPFFSFVGPDSSNASEHYMSAKTSPPSPDVQATSQSFSNIGPVSNDTDNGSEHHESAKRSPSPDVQATYTDSSTLSSDVGAVPNNSGSGSELHDQAKQFPSQNVLSDSTYSWFGDTTPVPEDKTLPSGDIILNGKTVAVINLKSDTYLACQETLQAMGVEKRILKKGYSFIDKSLARNGMSTEFAFIYKGKARQWIRLKAVQVLLSDNTNCSTAYGKVEHDLMHILNNKCDMDQSDENKNIHWTSTPLHSHNNKTCDTIPVSPVNRDKSCPPSFETPKTSKQSGQIKPFPNIPPQIKLNGVIAGVICSQGRCFLTCRNTLDALGMLKHLKKEGYLFIDKKLEKLKLPKESCFLFSGRNRTYISLDAALALASIRVSDSSVAEELKSLQRRVEEEKSARSTSSSPVSSVHLKRKRPTPKRLKKKKLKTTLDMCLKYTFKNDKTAMMDALSTVVGNKNDTKDQTSPFFGKKDIVQILEKVPSSKKKKKACKNLLQEISNENTSSKLTPQLLVQLEENFSGTRLTYQLRKALPSQLPTNKIVMEQKREYWREFYSILLPERTSTGWKVNPQRLLELLSFKYYWLEDNKPKHWKVYGDARLVGGQSSTFIGITTLNNEAALYGIRYQDPNEVFPFTMFYEKDSRDNLEENLGYPDSWLDTFFKKNQNEGHHFYLCGDEMFLEAVLDGSDVLGPTSEEGWDIYTSSCRADKLKTKDNLRTKLTHEMNRPHDETLFKSIPLCNTVICLLHAVARSVEKLLTLEVQLILKRSNQEVQMGKDGAAYIKEKVTNLENNINKRGVRQAGFKIKFEKNGKLVPIKLNKTHAIAILSPPPPEQADVFPHVLHNVCPISYVTNTLPQNVTKLLGLQPRYTEVSLAMEIWSNFNSMVEILRSDPAPTLKSIEKKGSLNPEDYHHGHKAEDVTIYKNHAECFYQLFKLRYSAEELTPYMMKLIDHAPYFMENFPFTLGRMQSEGGEHANYQHNRYFYAHTTRGGGKSKQQTDPILCTMNNMYKRIVYQIMTEETPSGQIAAEAFQKYKEKCVKSAGIPKSTNPLDMKCHVSVDKPMSKEAQATSDKLIFNKLNFVLCGSIPKYQGKTQTQEKITALIKAQGGRVRKLLPKSLSTKKYIIVANENLAKKQKVPSQIREGLQMGFEVVGYSFIFRAIEIGTVPDTSDFLIHFDHCDSGITKRISLEEKHFRKKKFSFFLKKRKKLSKMKKVKLKTGNPGLFYVRKKIKEENRSVSFSECQHLFKKHFEEYKQIPLPDRVKIVKEWEKEVQCKKDIIEQSKSKNPSYSKYI